MPVISRRALDSNAIGVLAGFFCSRHCPAQAQSARVLVPFHHALHAQVRARDDGLPCINGLGIGRSETGGLRAQRHETSDLAERQRRSGGPAEPVARSRLSTLCDNGFSQRSVGYSRNALNEVAFQGIFAAVSGQGRVRQPQQRDTPGKGLPRPRRPHHHVSSIPTTLRATTSSGLSSRPSVNSSARWPWRSRCGSALHQGLLWDSDGSLDERFRTPPASSNPSSPCR